MGIKCAELDEAKKNHRPIIRDLTQYITKLEKECLAEKRLDARKVARGTKPSGSSRASAFPRAAASGLPRAASPREAASGLPRAASPREAASGLPRDAVNLILKDHQTIIARDQLEERRRMRQLPNFVIVDPYKLLRDIGDNPVNPFNFTYNQTNWTLGFTFGFNPTAYVLNAQRRHAINYETDRTEVMNIDKSLFSNVREEMELLETVIRNCSALWNLANAIRHQEIANSFHTTPVVYKNKLSLRDYLSNIKVDLSEIEKKTLASVLLHHSTLLNSNRLIYENNWKLDITPTAMRMYHKVTPTPPVIRLDKNGEAPYTIHIDERLYPNDQDRYVMMKSFIHAMNIVFPDIQTIVYFTRTMPLNAYMTLLYSEVNSRQAGGRKKSTVAGPRLRGSKKGVRQSH